MPIFNSVYKSFEQGWKPGANTIIYCPFDDDLLDHSGNSTSLTTANSPSITTYNGVKCMASLASNTNQPKIYSGTLSSLGSSYTMQVWVNNISKSGNDVPFLVKGTGANQKGMWTGARINNLGSSIWGVGYSSDASVTFTGWHLLTVTYSGTTLTVYWDATQKYTYTVSYTLDNVASLGGFYNTNTSGYSQNYYSNWIVENKSRTAQEVSDYYNQTKGDYGL